MRVILATSNPPIEIQELVYNSCDTINTWALNEKFDEELAKDTYANDTYYFLQKMLGPMMTIIRRGLKVDQAKRLEASAIVTKKVETLQATLDTFAASLWNKGLNPRSHVQLKAFFLEWLCIPPAQLITKKKGESKVTFDNDKLEALAKNHIRAKLFCNLIIRIRELSKQLDVLNAELYDGRFLSTYNVAGTETLRLSCSEHPFWCGGNAQNIDRNLRNFFIADEGYVFVQADQQGAEARGVAYLSGDENYIEAVNSADVHTFVAAMTYGFPATREYSEKRHPSGRTDTDTYRQVTKATTHGTNYYATPWTVAKNAGIPQEEAETFQMRYFKRFPGVKEWQLDVHKKLQKEGFLLNPFGFKRRFWDRAESDTTLREAIANGPQSMIGIITNIGLYKLWLKYEGLPGAPVQILANGHDASIFQIREDQLSLMPELIDLLTITVDVKDIKGKLRSMTIPIEAETGPSWGKKEMVKWKC